jgi:hypothetical protein
VVPNLLVSSFGIIVEDGVPVDFNDNYSKPVTPDANGSGLRCEAAAGSMRINTEITSAHKFIGRRDYAFAT